MLQIIFIVYASYKLFSYIWSLVSGSAYNGAHDKLEASAMIVGTTIGFVSVTALSIIAAVYPTTSFAFVLAIVLAAIHGVSALLFCSMRTFLACNYKYCVNDIVHCFTCNRCINGR